MKPTLNGRISSLETVYTEIIKPMRADLRCIKSNTQKMSIQNDELLRKVGEHHTFINTLKIAKCPNGRMVSDEDRKKDERWLDQKKYKIMIWGLIITITGLIVSNMATCAWVSNNFNSIIQSMPK